MEAVWLFSLQEWGAEQTDRYIDDLTAAFEFLADSPKAGTRCEKIRAGYRKYPVIRHVVYHREKTSTTDTESGRRSCGRGRTCGCLWEPRCSAPG